MAKEEPIRVEAVVKEALPNAKMLATARHAIIVASDLSIAYGGLETGYWVQDCSAAVENMLFLLVGTVVFLGIIAVATLPNVSIAKVKGVTSKRSTSFTSPPRTPP